jgi:hypothetical protein
VREQPRFLNYIADATPQLYAIPVRSSFLFYEDFSLRWNEQSVDQLQQGSLSAPTTPQQYQRFSTRNPQRDIRNNFPHRAGARSHGHILKLDRISIRLWRCQMHLRYRREPLV